MKEGKTANDVDVSILDESITAEQKIINDILKCAKGTFQTEVAQNLITNSFVIEYLATGSKLRGKAQSYNSKYNKSVSNLMDRIENILPGKWTLYRDSVGPKGAFWYYIYYY